MKKNESLHQLIHSLSTNEKRFFKIYASRHTIGQENNYVKLFSLFEKVKTYEEKKINQLASKASFVKYFAAEKNYLYNLILDCLDAYHRDSCIDKKISKLINIGRVLMEKKLNAQGASVLENAKKLSMLHDRQENIGSINYLLKMSDFASEAVSIESLSSQHLQEQLSLNQLIEKQKFQQALEQLLLYRRLYGITAEKETVRRLTRKYPHVGEEMPVEFPSFGIEVYYLISRLEFCRITRNKKEGSLIYRRLIHLMENNRNKITGEYIEIYIYAHYVFLVGRFGVKSEDTDLILDKLKCLDKYIDSKLTKSENARCFEYHSVALTDFFLEHKTYDKIREVIDDFNQAFKIYESYMTPTFILSLHFNLACLYFGLGEYREALKWSNKVRNMNTEFREDIFHDLRTINLIIHLELDNEDILPSLIKSAAYHHKKAKQKVGLQKAIIKSINKILRAKTQKEKQKIYSQLKDSLILLRDNPLENHIFYDVDLVEWVSKKCR